MGPLAAGKPASSHYVVAHDVEAQEHVLLLDDAMVGRSPELQAIAGLLMWSINAEVARRSADHLLIHAGCVARHGSAAVIVGESGAGKSTLVVRLVRDGWAYLSDEAAAFQLTQGTVAPYPKPVTLKPGSWTLFPDLEPAVPEVFPSFRVTRWLLHPDAIRPESVGGTAEARWIFFLRRRPGLAAHARPIRAAEAMVRMLRQCLNPSAMTQQGMDVLRSSTTRCEIYELQCADSVAARQLIGQITGE